MTSTVRDQARHVPETDEEFRTRLRAFLTENHPGRRPRDAVEALAWQKAWLATLFDAGYAGPSWPRE